LDLAGFSLEEYEGKDDEDDDSDEPDIEDTEEEEIDFFLKDGAQKKRPSTSLSKKERLEAELEQAIKDEDYEKAAQLRDEIEGLK
jgi:protein-arginine kinase activator protein McsA